MRCCFSFVLTTMILPLAVWARAGSAPAVELPDLFLPHGVHGTLLIASLDGQREYVLHAQRAGDRFAAASTFKIANTLIALQEAQIRPDERFVWDGTVHEFAAAPAYRAPGPAGPPPAAVTCQRVFPGLVAA